MPTRSTSFITTALPYVNSVPHLGFALELVLADAHARYLRSQGKQVRFQTGSDENSLKNVQAAEAEGVETRELVDRYAARFEALNGVMKLTAEAFVRTSADPSHAVGAQKLWQRCLASGDIYLKHYTGLYCVGCEVFYSPGELEGGLCPDHGTKPEEIGEQNYFFRLSKYADRLKELIESDQLRIEPEVRKNEILSFIRMGLEDFSVSRSTERARGWGIPVPGDPGQVMYVWFDALTSYITGLGYAEDGELFRTYWLESQERIHVIGKGITRFHTLYWPAMLMSAGLPLPTNVYVHGYITLEGKKISKSLGNVIDPFEVFEKYGVEPIRYFLLRHVRSTEDGDFSVARFAVAYNADLADRLGNLLNRTLSMIDRYFEGRVPAPATEPDAKLVETAASVAAAIPRAMAVLHPHDALTALWRLVDGANRYVEESTPWALDKQRKKAASDAERAVANDKLATALYSLAEALRLIAHHLTPFLPEASTEMRKQLGIAGPETRDPDAASRWGGLAPGAQLGPRKVLFPKIELETPTA